MRVGVKRDVGERVFPADEPIVLLQVAFHDAQSGIAFGVPFGDQMFFLAQFVFGREDHPIARHRDIGLVAVLFEEHPLQHLRAGKAVRRNQRRTFGQIPDDGVRFRQEAPVVKFQRRHAAIRVFGQELGLAREARDHVDVHRLQRDAQLRRGQNGLEAISRPRVLVERVHGSSYLDQPQVWPLFCSLR